MRPFNNLLNNRLTLRYITCIIFALCFCSTSYAQKHIPDDKALIEKVFNYKSKHIGQQPDTVGSAYFKSILLTLKRNPTLMCIPTMFSVSRGNRNHIIESYSELKYVNGMISDVKQTARTGTIPHNRETMPTMITFVMPDIYNVTIYGDHTISPLNYKNRLYYKYDVSHKSDSVAHIRFTPRIDNTQLVEGWADVDSATGRVILIEINGEYDMSRFAIDIEMNDEDNYPLTPKKCDSNVTFKFLGNEIFTQYHAFYKIGKPQGVEPQCRKERTVMEKLRAASLSDLENDIYAEYDSIRSVKTAQNEKEKEKTKKKEWHKLLWDNVGDKVLSRQKLRFGREDQGTFKLSPILNPLYLGYSGRKGLTYKFNLRMWYKFSDEQNLSMAFKGGYSFKQHQFYFRVPIAFNYNKEHNAYVKFEFGNGNRIVNSEILDAITDKDSIKDIAEGMRHFRDLNISLVNHYDFNDYVGIEGGFIIHRRSAINKKGFDIAGKPNTYTSFSPLIELQLRPGGFKGVIFTLDYERGIKGIFNTNTAYQRFEGDISYKYNYHKLRSISFRLGGGLYTERGKDAYFMDFVNFREENIIGGWDEEWSCDFHLLSSAYYNASQYYVRFNTVYESPIMLMSRIPFLGRYVENERIYNNMLFVKNLHIYAENGYGFTTRYLSLGLFVATENGRYDGFGCKFGFELFRDW